MGSAIESYLLFPFGPVVCRGSLCLLWAFASRGGEHFNKTWWSACKMRLVPTAARTEVLQSVWVGRRVLVLGWFPQGREMVLANSFVPGGLTHYPCLSGPWSKMNKSLYLLSSPSIFQTACSMPYLHRLFLILSHSGWTLHFQTPSKVLLEPSLPIVKIPGLSPACCNNFLPSKASVMEIFPPHLWAPQCGIFFPTFSTLSAPSPPW